MPFSLELLHPPVTHFPIALLIVGSVAGLAYLAGLRRPELASLTWWLLLLGWLATLAAILTGLLAQAWLPPQAPYRSILNWHIGTGFALAALYGGVLYWGWLRHARAQRAAPTQQNAGVIPPKLLDDPAARPWLILLLLAGIGLVVASGWNGGRLVYTWGVNVLGAYGLSITVDMLRTNCLP